MPNRQRFSVPLSGLLDSSGNGKATVMPPPSAAYWSVLTLAGAALGNPVWIIKYLGQVVQSGSGANVALSIHPLSPGETIDIEITNGTQNSNWTATLYGTLTDSEQDAMSMWQPSLSASSALTTQSPFIVLKNVPTDSGIYTFNDTSLHTLTFNLPPNAQGFRWKWKTNGGCVATTLRIQGNKSFTLLNAYNGADFSGQTLAVGIQADQFYIIAPTDTQLILTVQLASGDVSIETDAYVSNTVEAVQLTGLIGNLDNFAIVVRNSTTAAPAPWQAASSFYPVSVVSVASGGTQAILTAQPGFRWFLHTYSFSQDNANAASYWQLQDSAGNLLHSWFDGAIRKVFASGDFRGAALPVNTGVRIFNGGGNASFIGGGLTASLGV